MWMLLRRLVAYPPAALCATRLICRHVAVNFAKVAPCLVITLVASTASQHGVALLRRPTPARPTRPWPTASAGRITNASRAAATVKRRHHHLLQLLHEGLHPLLGIITLDRFGDLCHLCLKPPLPFDPELLETDPTSFVTDASAVLSLIEPMARLGALVVVAICSVALQLGLVDRPFAEPNREPVPPHCWHRAMPRRPNQTQLALAVPVLVVVILVPAPLAAEPA